MVSSSKFKESFIKVNKDNPFPIQNLPYGVFKKLNETFEQRRIGVAIGDFVLDLHYLSNSDLFKIFPQELVNSLKQNTLNDFFSLTPQERQQVRKQLQTILDKDSTVFQNDSINLEKAIIKMDDVDMCMPIEIGDYTDFYASRNHAENVGEMFRGKDNKLMPNWLHMPIGYHGRSSSVNINKDVVRPYGQINNGEFKLETKLDYELEIAMIVGGKTNKQFDIIPINKASENIAGYCLMNDHSARMIQKTEYQPLGPFLGKNFSTSISPWIVVPEAIEVFKQKIPQQPNILPYLKANENYIYDIPLQVYVQPKGSPDKVLITDSNMKYLYWTFEQMIAHHTISGCNLRPGNLFGSGTISGLQHNKNGGCLLELTWNGQKPLTINNQKYTFLEDGDILTMTGGNYLEENGPFIGFGNLINKYVSNKMQIN